MRYYVEAYGCTMNQGETRMLAEELNGCGHTEVEDPGDADVAVIGTCVVISKTEERMKRRIEELSEICSEVKVTGCLTTTKTDEKIAMSSNVDYIEPDNIGMSFEPDDGLIGVIPIASGCIGDCSYCITKLARGYLKSRSPKDIKCRFERLLESSTWEIQLTCQDTASYGRDIGYSLPGLLSDLLQSEKDFRIRIGMMNPDTAYPIKDEIKSLLKDKRIYKFLHLPLQSGSKKVLEAMNRNYSPENWISLVREFREKFPEITISTDVIAGYPGETEDDFQKTIDLIEEARPDIVNVTRFSARPGTEANSSSSKLHSRKKKVRSKKLTELRFNISRERNKDHVGKKMEATVLEEGKGDTLKARTDNYKVVVIDENASFIGKRVKVEIVGAEDVYLKGRLIRPV